MRIYAVALGISRNGKGYNAMRIIRYFGALLAIMGSIKIWLHMTTETGLALISCLGNTYTLPMTSASTVHCWGCYAAALGVIIFTLSFVRKPRQTTTLHIAR